ncbi:MAG: Ig-like domain-containing protein [Patescibacteria group bacterium]
MKHLHRIGAGALSLGLLLGALPVFAASSAITIGTVTPTDATTYVPVTLSANVSSSAGSISSCSLYVDNDDKGAMTVSSGSASKSFTFTNSQIYTVFVFCRDSVGNFNSGPNAAVWAKGGSSGGGDIVPPVMGSISPASATVGQSVTFTVNVSDTGGIASCNLFVGGVDRGAMTLGTGVATKAYTFTQDGTSAVYAQCRDTSSNTGTSASTAVSVMKQVILPGPTQGALIKLVCPAGALSDNPCKAVYYNGTDGKRHAFPNDKVYFTWYANFDAVTEVSASAMAALPLGKNVTYRPGTRMVKFASVPMVYAIAKGGELRWVKTEADAITLYGADWNKKIDDISEAFFANYRYGADITPSAPFNVQTEMNSATTIDQNL